MISRFVEKRILASLKPGKVVCLFGARRTGKTVLIEKIAEGLTRAKKRVLLVHGQDLLVKDALSSRQIAKLAAFVQGYDFVFVDEAQEIPNIGVSLKLMADAVTDVSVLVTGSSAFDLRQQIGEPLVGRSVFLHLHPIAQLELAPVENFLQSQERLESRLVYGSYPEIITAKTEKEKVHLLENIRDGYLLKDILALENLKDSLFVFNLLRQIAFQIGHDISYAEIAQNLNAHPKTVRRYLELLEKTFVLFSHPGYSRNLREEYTKTPRYYFWDNGIRNILISNFNSLALRDDVGALWENYCIAERVKRNTYKDVLAYYFYWRTYAQKEIDLVEEREGRLYGFEMKWGQGRVKEPKDFLKTYPRSRYQTINRDNYLKFIL